MSLAIDMRAKDLSAVRDILAAHLPAGSRVWVFGSRATGRARRGSDLDLAVDGGRVLRRVELSGLADAFDESDLPYEVDVVDLRAVSAAFRAAIEGGMVQIGFEKGDGGQV